MDNSDLNKLFSIMSNGHTGSHLSRSSRVPLMHNDNQFNENANPSTVAAAKLASDRGFEFVQVSAKTEHNIPLLCAKIQQCLNSITPCPPPPESRRADLTDICQLL